MALSVRSCNFNGSTYLTSKIGGSGLIFPTSSGQGCISFWYNIPNYVAPMNAYTQFRVINISVDQSSLGYRAADLISLIFVRGDGQGGHLNNFFLSFTIGKNSGADPQTIPSLTIGYLNNPLPIDSNWHHVLIAWNSNASTPALFGALDGTVLVNPPFQSQNFHWGFWNDVSKTGSPAGPFVTSYSVGADVGIGAQAGEFVGVGPLYQSSLAEVYLNVEAASLVSQFPGLLNQFIDANGNAVELGGTGYAPFGKDYPPQIYMSGGPNSFALGLPQTQTAFAINQTANPWSINGSLGAASSDPFIAGIV